MSGIESVKKIAGSQYLAMYQIDGVQRDGTHIDYYMASRILDEKKLKAVTHNYRSDGVIVYAVDDQHRLALVRQYRYPVGGYVYELPAGQIDPGESLIEAGIRELYEETGLTLAPIDAGDWQRPFFTTDGMTDESVATIFGRCSGSPSSRNQEASEDIQVVMADRTEAARILKEEHVALMCAYMLMQFVSGEGDPLDFVRK